MISSITKRPNGLFLFIYLYSFLWAQTVSEIQIVGIKKTKEYVVKREIQHSKYHSLDSTLATQDRDRIDNLGIFSDVQWKSIPLEDGSVILQFSVTESWNNIKGAMPIYSEEYGWSVTGGYIIKNLGGRNQMLEIGGSIGGQNNYGFQFFDPWIFGDHVSAEFELGKSTNNHLFLNLEKRVTSLSFGMGRYFNKYFRTKFEIEIEKKIFSEDITDTMNDDIYKYVSLFGSIGYDSRDVYSNPSKGIKIKNSLYGQIDHESTDKNRLVWNHSSSVFHTIVPGEKKVILGINLSNQLSWGNQNAVWLYYIGGGNSVRGWKMPSRKLYESNDQQYRFGHHLIQSSVELRKVIIPKHATQYGNEIGLDIGLFFDVGMTSIELNELMNQTPLFGTGFGMRIPMPMIGVLRLDYGWAFYEGKHIESSFHLAMGHRF